MLKRIIHRCQPNFYVKPLRYLNRSLQLARKVKIEVYLPPNYYRNSKQNFPLLLINDGQDFERLGMVKVLSKMYDEGLMQSAIVVGIHADSHRVLEYGTAMREAYNGFGSMANRYTRFIMSELVPFLRSKFRCATSSDQTAIAGFSLGGLSALDIAWAHPETFGKVGVFSGSLWWRHTSFREEDPDADRIMFEVVESSAKKEGLRFWFMAGTNDETSDRNNNGVIDAIDDTKDMLNLLLQKGYSPDDLYYTEVEGGEHNPTTWGEVMPQFLRWAFPTGEAMD